MTVVQLEDGRVSIEFEINDDELHPFRDALVMTSEEYSLLTEDQILSMQRARFDAWITLIKTPHVGEPTVPVISEPEPVEMTEEEFYRLMGTPP